jgi:hypothetical protein
MAAEQRNLQNAKWSLSGAPLDLGAQTEALEVSPMNPNILVDAASSVRTGVVPYVVQHDVVAGSTAYTVAWSLRTDSTALVLSTADLDTILIAQEDLESVEIEALIAVTAAANTDVITPYIKGYNPDGSLWSWLSAKSISPPNPLTGGTANTQYKFSVKLGRVPKGFGFFVGTIFSTGSATAMTLYQSTLTCLPAKAGRD